VANGDESDRVAEQAGTERRIGRRAFIGLIIAGLAALFLGREIIPRIPGGVTRSLQGGDFRINSIAAGPTFDPATWRLTVDGLVRKPLTLTFTQFSDIPQVEVTRDFECVEGWGVTGVVWKGVTMRDLLNRADIDPRATHLIFYSGDGAYTDSLTLEEALRSDTLLALEMNRVPLTPEMGRPVRLILPSNYGYKYVKWVVRVEAAAPGSAGYKGYWEQYGYPADARIG
jgi:sulfoxide reductase catalytic subunit YedY